MNQNENEEEEIERNKIINRLREEKTSGMLNSDWDRGGDAGVLWAETAHYKELNDAVTKWAELTTYFSS